MIVSFTLSNFKSFKEPMSLEMSPGNSRAKNDHISDDECLKATAIFGSNSFGKSNFIKGLKTLKGLVTDPYFNTKGEICNWDSKDKITKFEIVFNYNGKRYDYLLWVTPNGFSSKDGNGLCTYSVDREMLSEIKSTDLHPQDEWSEIIFEYGGPNTAKQESEIAELMDIIEKKKRECEKLNSIIIKTESEYKVLEDLIEKQKVAVKGVNQSLDDSKDYVEKAKNLKIMIVQCNEEIKSAEQTLAVEERKLADYQKNLSDLDDKLSNPEINKTDADRFENQKVEIGRKLISHQIYCSDLKELVRNSLEKLECLEEERELIESKLAMRNQVVHDTNALAKTELELKMLGKQLIERKKTLISKNRELALLRKNLVNLAPKTVDNKPILLSKKIDALPEKFNKNLDAIKTAINDVYDWFVSSLVILETTDFHMPQNRLDYMNELSRIISALDVGICGLEWSDCDNPDSIRNMLSNADDAKLNRIRDFSVAEACEASRIVKTPSGLYEYKYWSGEETVREIRIKHSFDSKASFSMSEESDGTKRIIELASMLMPSDREKVFIVDEIDRRLHPLMTKQLIKLFLDNNPGNKQLIFATHETKLLTTDIFRKDEIWFVTKNNGKSELTSLDNVKSIDKRIEKMYMEGRLPGAPNLGSLEF